MNVESGVVTWLNGEIDSAPEYMYNHSFHYDESLYNTEAF